MEKFKKMELRILAQLILLFMFRLQWLFRTGTSVTIPHAKGITCYLNESSSISLSPPLEHVSTRCNFPVSNPILITPHSLIRQNVNSYTIIIL